MFALPKPADQLVALKQENAELRRQAAHVDVLCREQQATIGQLQSRLETMAEQIVLLKKALFGRRRERYAPSPDQPLLFPSEPLEQEDDQQPGEEGEAAESNEDASQSTEPKQRGKHRPKRNRFEFPECLPVTRIEHPLEGEELACPCGCGDRVKIDEHVTRQLELTPAHAHVVEHVRYTYACPKCRDGQQMATTEKPETVNEKGIFGPTVLAYLADGKFARHLPLYRLQEQLQTSSRMWVTVL